MGAEGDFSESHAPTVKLNDAAWTISCGKPDVAPVAKQSLPKYALEALHSEGRVPDPLAGRNEEELRWVALEVWTFTRSFDVPEGMSAKCMASRELVLDGVDTVASVTLNGKHLADLQNAHRQHRIDVDNFLRAKDNTLSISIKPAISEALSRKEAYPYAVPFVQAPRALPHYNFLRKPASDFGWDWGPAFAAAGLGSVAVECCKGARITSVMVRQDHSGCRGEDGEDKVERMVTLYFDVTVSFAAPKARDPYDSEQVWLGVSLRDCGRLGTVDPEGVWDGNALTPILKKSIGRQKTYSLAVCADKEDVTLWWPNGCGGQYMYGFEVYLADNCHKEETHPLGYRELSIVHWKEVSVGLRDIKLVRESLPDAAGETFEFHVNGVPIFAKGANVIPLDILPSRVTGDYISQLVSTAADSHMNMLRVWGGGGYLPDSFYESCSRTGILVWQEAMFACAFYPRDKAFLKEVEREVRYQARRLNQYTCMAVWGGNNELEPALGWFPESRDSPIRYAVDFAELFVNTVREVLAAVDNGKHAIPFVDSSPSNGIVSEDPYVKRWGDSGSTAFGDVHYYTYTTDVLDPSIYPKAKFISEFGFQSWPSWPLYKQVTTKEDWSQYSYMSAFRMRHPNGIQELEDQLARHFRLPAPGGRPEDFHKYIYLTQIQQGLCYHAAIGHWRFLRSDPVARTMGILYWQLNDIWAIISDLMYPIAGELVIEFVPWAAQKESELRPIIRVQVSVDSRQSKSPAVVHLKGLKAMQQYAEDPSTGYLALEFRGVAEGRQHSTRAEVYLSEFKDAKLSKQSVRVVDVTIKSRQGAVSGNESEASIVLRSDTVAALVALETENLPGSFSPNACTITPWTAYKVEYKCTGPIPPSKEYLMQDLRIFSVESAVRATKRKGPA